MFIRQVKRKCNVRGCKSTDCFAIARTREIGNTVIICKSCLGKALGAIDEIDPKTKSNIPTVNNRAVPSLFFNSKALGTEVKAIDNNATNADKGKEQLDNVSPIPDTEEDIEKATTSADNVEDFKCPICDKIFDSEKGLKTHLRYCKQVKE